MSALEQISETGWNDLAGKLNDQHLRYLQEVRDATAITHWHPTQIPGSAQWEARRLGLAAIDPAKYGLNAYMSRLAALHVIERFPLEAITTLSTIEAIAAESPDQKTAARDQRELLALTAANTNRSLGVIADAEELDLPETGVAVTFDEDGPRAVYFERTKDSPSRLITDPKQVAAAANQLNEISQAAAWNDAAALLIEHAFMGA